MKIKTNQGIVAHNATEGCQRCTVRGEKINNRMCYARTDCPKRTDMEFRNRTHPDHHNEFSVIEYLPIDLINDFVVADELHLLHLGVMRKCLWIWKDGLSNFEFNWTNDDIKNLNEMLKNVNSDMPTDINRSVRSIDHLKYWKGTELRTFLLYVGVVVLKNVLRKVEYDHFVKLFCAVTLCCTDKYINKNRTRISDLISDLFNEYIEEFVDIYGIEYISSNVHNLTHVIDDVSRFGNLTKISAYRFENSLAALKLRLRNCNRPLEQISRRIVELDLDFRNPIDLEENDTEPILKNQFNNADGNVFKQIIFGSDLLLNNQKFGDNFFLTCKGQVVEFHHALKRNNEYLLYGSSIKKLNDFFTQPFSSSKIYVFSAKDEKSTPNYFKIENVMAKMICLRNGDEYIFIPMLHTLK